MPVIHNKTVHLVWQRDPESGQRVHLLALHAWHMYVLPLAYQRVVSKHSLVGNMLSKSGCAVMYPKKPFRGCQVGQVMLKNGVALCKEHVIPVFTQLSCPCTTLQRTRRSSLHTTVLPSQLSASYP